MSLAGIMETLDKQTVLYEQLLASAHEKTPMLVNNDIDGLNAITLRERKLLTESEQLEAIRIRHTHQYFLSLGYRSSFNRLSEVIQSVHQPEEKQRLIDKQQELAGLLTRFKRANDLNQQLIAQSLAFIDYSIGLMVEDPAGEMTYQHPQNKLSGYARTGIFDTRA